MNIKIHSIEYDYLSNLLSECGFTETTVGERGWEIKLSHKGERIHALVNGDKTLSVHRDNKRHKTVDLGERGALALETVIKMDKYVNCFIYRFFNKKPKPVIVLLPKKHKDYKWLCSNCNKGIKKNDEKSYSTTLKEYTHPWC